MTSHSATNHDGPTGSAIPPSMGPTLADTIGQPERPPLSDADAPVPGVDACPELATILGSMKTLDRETAKIIRILIPLQKTGAVVETTGVALELWLSQTGRATRSDRQMLQTAATVLGRMPVTMSAFESGRLSWSQVRTIVLSVFKLPIALQTAVDEALADEIDTYAGCDPDELLRRLIHAISAVVPSEEEKDHAAAVRDRFLSIQPSMFGEYNGKLYAEGPNEALTLIADGLDAMSPPPDAAVRDHVGADVDPNNETMVAQGRRRFDALVRMFGTHPFLTGNHDVAAVPYDDSDEPVDVIMKSGVPVKILLTVSLETLLAVQDHCGQLLSTLTGGQLKVNAKTARKLANGGAAVRMIVLDDTGEVLGVGRQQRFAPDWLTDAVRVMFPTSIAPGSRASTAHCDLDHHVEWDADDGPTDINNLAPVNRQFHTAKTAGEWTVRAGPEGSRIVEKPGSNWSQTHFPATRQIKIQLSTKKKATAPPA